MSTSTTGHSPGPLHRYDPISAVVTSSRAGEEFLTFDVGELRRDEVLANRSPRHVSEGMFQQRVQKVCDKA